MIDRQKEADSLARRMEMREEVRKWEDEYDAISSKLDGGRERRSELARKIRRQRVEITRLHNESIGRAHA